MCGCLTYLLILLFFVVSAYQAGFGWVAFLLLMLGLYFLRVALRERSLRRTHGRTAYHH